MELILSFWVISKPAVKRSIPNADCLFFVLVYGLFTFTTSIHFSMLIKKNQKVGITFKMLKKISQKLFKNVLVIIYELYVSSRKAAIWDGTFSSCGSDLAPVFGNSDE